MTTQRPISLFTLRAISFSLCLLISMAAIPANAKKQKGGEKKDSTALFQGIAVSADLVGVGQMLFGSYGQYEAAVRINLKDKYFPVIEAGLGKANAEDIATQLSYQSSAPYGRIGLDFNVMKNKHDDYRLYIGGRYAFSAFKYDISGPTLKDPVWGDEMAFEQAGNSATCHWLELVGGIDAKIWRFIRLGWSFRYKCRLFHTDAAIGTPWYIPGYGRNGGTRLGATFNVIFEL